MELWIGLPLLFLPRHGSRELFDAAADALVGYLIGCAVLCLILPWWGVVAFGGGLVVVFS